VRAAFVALVLAGCIPDAAAPDAGVPDAACPTYYADVDGDGHGDPGAPLVTCEPAAGLVATGDDCLDSNRYAFPGNPEVCDGLDNDCDGAIDPPATPTDPAQPGAPRCPADCAPMVDWTTHRRYLVCLSPTTWLAAQDVCHANGGELVHVADAQEQAFLAGTLGWMLQASIQSPPEPQQIIHLGGRRGEDDTWRWVDDQSVFWRDGAATELFANWSGPGTGDCVGFWWPGLPLFWTSEDCDDLHPFVCERDR